jgi:release factor glutamine methyltransferase
MTPTEQPWTIKRLLDWTQKYLADKGCEFPRLDAEVLLAHVMKCKRIQVYTRFDEIATDEMRTQFRDLIRQRVEGCPVAYLVGRKDFFSLELEVNRDVLIPRPDTETVVSECLRLAKEMTAPTILDIGTGSGNLVVALAKQHKTATLTAIDLSPAALAVAQRNAAKHGVAERIRFLEGNVFDPLIADERFDFIVSNPPYIPHGDIATLEAGVRDYEPHMALDGGVTGFAVFDCLVAEAPRHLKPGGYLLIEIGSPQETPGRERLLAHGGYDLERTIFDSAGHPRVLRARLKTSQSSA